MVDAARLARGEIQDHMPVVGSDGRPVRTVDRVGRDFIKPTRAEDAPGGRLRWRPLSTVAGLDGGLVRLSPPAAQAGAVLPDRGRGGRPPVPRSRRRRELSLASIASLALAPPEAARALGVLTRGRR